MKKFGLIGLFFITSILLFGCSQLGDQSKKNNNTWVKITNADTMDEDINIIHKKPFDDYSGFFYEIKGRVTGDVKNGDNISLLQSSSNGSGLYVVDTAKVGENKNSDENNNHNEFTLSAIVESDFIDTDEDVYITSDSLSKDSGYTPDDMNSLKHCLKISIKKPSDSDKQLVSDQSKTKSQKSNDEQTETSSTSIIKDSSVSREFKNALEKAESYLNYSAFSKEELKGQLIFNKFPEDAAQYAVDNVVTDWNEQALKKANSYLNNSAFSKEELKGQLIFNKFPEDAAQYAVDNVVADWNEQALKKANSYLNNSAFSNEELKNQLIFNKFTHEQAQYAIDNLSK